MTKIKIAFLVFTFMLLGFSLFSATYTSTGTGNWSDVATWGGGGYPIAGDDVTIATGHLVTLTGNAACRNLTLSGTSGTRLAIATYTCSVSGTVNGPSTSFTNAVITTGVGGKLKFIGASRTLFGLNWAASHAGWSCEIALDSGATGTTSTNVKIGFLTVTSGTFQIGSTTAAKDLRIDGDGATNGTGTVSIASGASLICTGLMGCRTGTTTTYCGNIDIYGTLVIQGARLNGTINVKNEGNLTLKRMSTSALVSVGGTTYNYTYDDGSTLQYDLQGTVGRVLTGAEISQVTNATTHNLYNITINNSSGIDLQATPTVAAKLKVIDGDITTTASKVVVFGANGILHYAGVTGTQITTEMCFPATDGPNSLYIENSSDVDLHANRTIPGTLSMIAGHLTTTTGKVLSFGSSGYLEYKGTLEQTTNDMEFPATNGPAYLITNNPGGVRLHASRTLSEDVYITGHLHWNSYSLTLTKHHMAITGTDNIFGFGPIFTATSNNLGGGNGTSLSDTWTTQGTVSGTVDIILYYNESENSDPQLRSWTRSVLDDDPIAWDYFVTHTTTDLGTTRSVVLSGLAVISSAGGNGMNWTLSPMGDVPNPVELTSFTADIFQTMFVNLQWTTQSETDLIGYNVYRSLGRYVDSAIQINSAIIPATNSSQPQTYSYHDAEVENNTYYYWLQHVNQDGTSAFNGPVSITVNSEGGITPPPTITNTTGLKSLSPNPFAGYATINYNLTKDAATIINIYNTKGQLVRTFNKGMKAIGYYSQAWDGLDSNGQECSSGVYLIHMTAGSKQSTLKAVLVK